MMEAVRTSETSIDNHFTRQYIPEDNSEHHTRRRENLKSHTSKMSYRKHYGTHTLFVVNFYNWCKSCHLLENFGISVPSRNFRDYLLFTVGSSRKSCPSARCALDANTVFSLFIYL
jgi:hypothetical protein